MSDKGPKARRNSRRLLGRSEGNSGHPRRGSARGLLVWVLVTVGLAAAAAGALGTLERGMLAGKAKTAPTRIEVRLIGAPEWMPASLVARIAKNLLPADAQYYDRQLTFRVHRVAQGCPWVRTVRRVEKYRSSDPAVAVVEVEAEFRMPVARIGTPAAGYAYLDADGIRVPSEDVAYWAAEDPRKAGPKAYYHDRQDVPRGQRVYGVHYVTIEGVAATLPAVGQRWEGQDVADGLFLIKLISSRPYAYQITVVDVRNHGGRISDSEPELRMYAEVKGSQPTDIRFGRFPLPGGDHVVSPERRLSYLDAYAADHKGLLAGINRYLDLRYDELHVSIN